MRKNFFQSCIVIVVLFLTSAAAFAANQTVLTIPAHALIFSGPGLLGPDEEGHFAIGIELPQPAIKATRCETPYLILGIGTLNKPANELTASDQKRITQNKAYYIKLMGAKDKTLNIPVSNDAKYLKIKDGVVYAAYCTLSIDQERLP